MSLGSPSAMSLLSPGLITMNTMRMIFSSIIMIDNGINDEHDVIG